jgi:hypothetical protein
MVRAIAKRGWRGDGQIDGFKRGPKLQICHLLQVGRAVVGA